MKKEIWNWINEKGDVILNPLINNKLFDRFTNTIFQRFEKDPLLTYAIAIRWNESIKSDDERYARAYSLKQILEREMENRGLMKKFKEFEKNIRDYFHSYERKKVWLT